MFCETNKLNIIFKNITVLENVSLNVQSCQTTVILGKNGSGKSTLLRCLNYLLVPTSGFINHKYNKSFPMLFQSPAVFDNTIQYNFEILSKIKKIEPLLEWYQSFNLEKIKNIRINKVSGGEQQKTFLSRIMSVDPKVIIMDEPNQNLDKESNEMLIKLIVNQKKKNKTIIIVSHDIDFVKQIADRIVLLDYGKIIFNGFKTDFFKS